MQSAIRNPQSTIAHSGITLMEVLISMGVMTVGLLGVAALFPVGSFYALRGEIYDRADAAAAAALNDAVTRGLLDPEEWVSFQTSTGGRTSPNLPGTFTRPFAADLGNQLAFWDSLSAAQRQLQINNAAGSMYFIDPVGVASGVNPDRNSSNYSCSEKLKAVPASFGSLWMWPTPSPGLAKTAWAPWARTAPIQRLSLKAQNASGQVTYPLSLSQARRVAMVQDDLIVDQDALRGNPDWPAPVFSRSATIGGVSTVLGKEAQENFSYVLSVVPQTVEARDALAFGGRGQAYEVSAAVFHRRPPNRYDPSDDFEGIEGLARAERLCRASIVSGGAGGGEIRALKVQWGPDGVTDTDPWENLKTGTYLFLFGPDPKSTPERPLMFGKWYRVVALDEGDVGGNIGPSVALRGPDWPWAETSATQTTDYNQPPTDLQDDIRMVIFDGVVAVHTRTMRLDAGTAWNN